MELHQVLQVFIYAALAVGGWFMKSLWQAVSMLKDDLHEIKEDLGRNYVPRDEIRDYHEQTLRAIENLHNELKQHEIREYAWHKETVHELSGKSK